MNSLALSESIPCKGNGNRPRASRSAWKTVCWPRLRSATHSVQPVATSVTVRLCRYSPRVVLPQCTRQIDFGKARLGFIPLGKGANRDSALEECARLGGSQSMRFGALALGLQEAIGCRWTEARASALWSAPPGAVPRTVRAPAPTPADRAPGACYKCHWRLASRSPALVALQRHTDAGAPVSCAPWSW